MGIVLPDALAWVLDLIGINWPNIDEDELRSAADELRQIQQELGGNTDAAKSSVEQMLGANSSQSLQLFEALWNKVASGHLPQLAEGMGLLATGLDVSAGVVVGLKAAAIVQLGVLAGEIIADQAAAPFTFGGSEAAIPGEIAATRAIVKEIVDQAVQSVEQQLMQAVEGPVFNALDSAGEELAGQLLGDALGTNSGVNLGDVARAGGSGLQQGVHDSVGQVTGGAAP